MSRIPAVPVRKVLTVCALVALAGCASANPPRQAGSPFSSELSERGEIQLKIINMNFADATVWALIRDGRRQRLGLVTGKTDAVFTIPWTFSEPLRLEFDLIAGVRCITDQIVTDPGDVLELQIAVDLSSDPQCSRR